MRVDKGSRLIPLLEPIRADMAQVDWWLHETTARVEEPLASKLGSLLGGGKRMRPALAILSGQVFVPSSEPFYKLAAAVEMLHTATLIHDDVVDESPTRRGRRTLHTMWPTGAAVLAGDYLMALAASLIAELERPRILKVFADTLCVMCAGEIRQMLATVEGRRDREAYYRHIGAKTASLCAAATEMAGILAGADEAHISALRRFGWELGIAFQIVDDVLDFVGDEAQLGKPAGSDLGQGIVTLPVVHYLEAARDDAVVGVVLSSERDEAHVRAAVEAVCASGAIEVSLAEAVAAARQGQEALASLPGNAARHMLCALADYAVTRRR
jgi:geranylgeranyl pyrophosphate synthase